MGMALNAEVGARQNGDSSTGLRILLVTHTFPLRHGDPTAPFMARIVESLAARGHLVDVVLPFHPLFDYPEGNGIGFLPYRYSPLRRVAPWGFGGALTGSSRLAPAAALALPAAALTLRRCLSSMLSSRRYDVVHAHWLVPNAALAARCTTKFGVPLVATLHGSDIAVAERNRLLRGVARRTFAMTRAVTAVSKDLAIRAERLGADPAMLLTIPYGVDTDTFTPLASAREWRARFGVAGNTLLVVAVGRLLEVKGFRYAIEAAARVGGMRLVVVGDGDQLSELRRVAAELRAPVTFAGELAHDAIPGVLAAADVVVVPSVVAANGSVDGLPNTLLEALATGVPVIASAVGGIPDVVTQDVNGLLVGGKDVDALAAALALLRDRPALRERLGAAARRDAVVRLGWDAMARGFEAVYAATATGTRR